MYWTYVRSLRIILNLSNDVTTLILDLNYLTAHILGLHLNYVTAYLFVRNDITAHILNLNDVTAQILDLHYLTAHISLRNPKHINSWKFFECRVTFFRQIVLQNLQRKYLRFSETDILNLNYLTEHMFRQNYITAHILVSILKCSLFLSSHYPHSLPIYLITMILLTNLTGLLGP